MSVCEKCWGEAYMRMMSNTGKTQSDYYADILHEKELAGIVCTESEQKGIISKEQPNG